MYFLLETTYFSGCVPSWSYTVVLNAVSVKAINLIVYAKNRVKQPL